MKAEDFSDRLWDFAARVGKLVDALPDTRMGKHVAGQLVRSGTSSAPNYDEARSAESPAGGDLMIFDLGLGIFEF